MKLTWQKVIVFIGIIGLGLVGLMVADQYDFLGGREGDKITIGDGTADPLVTGTSSTTTATVPNEKTVIDGVKKPPCQKGKC
jgi:hypothetical protein